MKGLIRGQIRIGLQKTHLIAQKLDYQDLPERRPGGTKISLNLLQNQLMLNLFMDLEAILMPFGVQAPTVGGPSPYRWGVDHSGVRFCYFSLSKIVKYH